MNVRDVANLARMELSDEEASTLQEQMDHILKYVEQLNEIDVDGIEPTAHAGAVFDVVREDEESGYTISQEAALSNAPEVAHEQIKMPKVVE